MNEPAHPSSDAETRARPARRDAPETAGRTESSGAGSGNGGHRAPKPIGIEAMRALRKAIREGTYPTDADVIGGLVRIMHVSERRQRKS